MLFRSHYLLDVSYDYSKRITDLISHGDFSQKPGWIRLSVHPTMTDKELETIVTALHDISKTWKRRVKDYIYSPHTNEYKHFSAPKDETVKVRKWFNL